METATPHPARAARVPRPRTRLSNRAAPPRTGVALGLALAAAAAGVVVILASGFLVHPYWLALQRADLTLGSVVAGLYWWARRPTSRFGPMLVAFGAWAALLPLQASSSPVVHTLAALLEAPLVLWTFALVLAFPTGRLDGRAARASIAIVGAGLALWYVPLTLFASHVTGSVLAACTPGDCPANPFLLRAEPEFLTSWSRVTSALTLAGALLAAAVLVRRLVATTAPRRAMFTAGAAVGLAFLVAYAIYVALIVAGPGWQPDVGTPLTWTLVAALAFLPWGFLAALVAAELAAAHVLRQLCDDMIGNRSVRELQATLRSALGDGELRLGLWHRTFRLYIDGDGRPLTGPPTGTPVALTEVVSPHGKAAAILHRADLQDEPELVGAAVRGALLALDNARLESDLVESVRDLQRSRARLVAAGDAERRRIERDLHDSAQQQLVALRIKLGLALEPTNDERELRAALADLAVGLEDVLAELRELAHGIYPPVLTDEGLGAALASAALRATLPVTVDVDVERYRIEVESAVYYCCLEALQNAAKHAGPRARPSIVAAERDGLLVFAVADHGRGYDVLATSHGDGLRNMEDRLGAVGGQLEIESAAGAGTVVSGSVPLDAARRKSGERAAFAATPADGP